MKTGEAFVKVNIDIYLLNWDRWDSGDEERKVDLSSSL